MKKNITKEVQEFLQDSDKYIVCLGRLDNSGELKFKTITHRYPVEDMDQTRANFSKLIFELKQREQLPHEDKKTVDNLQNIKDLLQ